MTGATEPERAQDGPGSSRPDVEVTGGGTPTDEEVAAIAAAVETTSPQPQPAPPSRPPRWRFSGRWWSKPIPLRRSRPW